MNCIIIDDEPIARIGTEDLISCEKDLNLLRSFKSTAGVEDYLKQNSVQLIFLDIEMPGISGIEFAATIPEHTMIIFTTAYSEYALESYELDAIDYLVKPITEERFSKAVSKAVKYHHLLGSSDPITVENYNDSAIVIRADRRNYNILFEDILYIEALKDHVIVYTVNERLITWMNLKTIFSKLPASIFARVSKRHVVNYTKIKSYDNQLVYINDEIQLNIGKTYQQLVLSLLKK